MIACSPLMIRSETDSEGVKTVADLGGLGGGTRSPPSPPRANKVKDNKAGRVHEPSAAIVSIKLSECVRCCCCQRLKQSKGYF